MSALPEAAPQFAGRSLLRIVIVGHVDHGKSTLVGRLLHDTGSLPEGKVEALAASARRRGMPFEWAFLMDAAQAERDQGVTIDTAQIWLKTPHRDVVIIDAPGHTEFLKNMVTGAAQADAAVLVVDAQEGVAEQTRRHAYLLSLLGLTQVVVAVNKMDLVGYAADRFAQLETDIRAHLSVLGVVPAVVIPIAARAGVNVAGKDDAPATPWWNGGSLLEALEGLAPATAPSDKPLRLPIQDVYKFDERRIFAGRIEAGELCAGDELTFQPSGKTARVVRIESWPQPWPEELPARAGRSVGITLDKPLFLERGEVAGPSTAAPQSADRIKASVFWLGQAALSVGEAVTLKLGAAETTAVIEKIEKVIDTSTLAEADSAAVLRGQAAQVSFTLKRKVGVDAFAEQPRTGRFVLERGGVIVGGGLVTSAEAMTRYVIPARSGVSFAERAKRNGHRGGVLWLTGLSGSGKSTIAAAVERALFDRGWSVARLDGDDLRLGLNRDLSFSAADRTENIRRAAETAALLARAGMVVITPLISPLREDRARAREIVGKHFVEVFVSTALEVCEARDPKGLYAKARAGQIAEFTGVSAPYEPPLAPELAVDAGHLSPEEAAGRVIEHVQLAFFMDAGEPVWP